MSKNTSWQKCFGAEMAVFSEVVADGEQGWVLKRSAAGTFEALGWHVLTGDLTPLIDETMSFSLLNMTMSPDGRSLYFLQDDRGNELGHLVRLDVTGASELVDVTPEMTPYSLRGLAVSQAGDLVTFTAVSEADGYQLCCIPLTADGKFGPRRVIHQHSMEFWQAVPSYHGELVAIQSTQRTGNRRYSSLVFDTSSGDLVGELWDGAEHSVEVRSFSPVADDFRLLLTSTLSGFRRPIIWQPRTNERHDLELPDLAGDVIPLAWSPDASQILLKQFDRAMEQLFLYDVATSSVRRLAHPAGSFGTVYFTPDGRLLAHWQDASTPLQLIELDRETGTKKRALLAGNDVPDGRPYRSIEFVSSDGATVQGWLATPAGEGPFPTILHTHGGPHAAELNGFKPAVQAWLAQGFAFASINYRGSVTFGEAFRSKIWGDIGHWELEDMVAGRDWLVAEGISDPQAIILNGASYGGF